MNPLDQFDPMRLAAFDLMPMSDWVLVDLIASYRGELPSVSRTWFMEQGGAACLEPMLLSAGQTPEQVRWLLEKIKEWDDAGNL